MCQNKGYRAFCEYAKNKKFALIGLGVSNLPLVSFLLSAGAEGVSVRDLKKTDDCADVKQAKKDGATIILGKDYLTDLTENVIIRSPGIRPDIPPFLAAMENGSRITCETELFLEFCPCKTVAITGSDGKTTTTTLISKILSEAGYPVFLGGNIGKAMLPQLASIQDENSICVMELSSFQLMNCAFSPNISVITNLSENHLDWHQNMAEYLDAKKNILRHQNESSRAVLNYDNAFTRECSYSGKVIYFSRKAPKELLDQKDLDAVYELDGKICVRVNGKTTPYFHSDEILIPGKHNIENYMAAIAATFGLATCENVLNIARTFGGVEHRIELVRDLDGVKYYNSSIDSSPARSTAALNSFHEKVIMIAGGYDKKLDYTALGTVICRHVKILILCGATSEKILQATTSSPLYLKDHPKIICAEKFEDTVKIARNSAVAGDCVILSPASASFDLFRNFEERGKFFKKLVKEL